MTENLLLLPELDVSPHKEIEITQKAITMGESESYIHIHSALITTGKLKHCTIILSVTLGT